MTALTLAPAVDAAAVEAGYRDHTWAGNSSVNSPTQDKPQSKVWFTDGTWWGALFTDGDHRIHRYNAAQHTWSDTGVAVDTRNSSHGDYLWDEATDSLYVASVNGDSDPDPILVFKLNYDSASDTYTHDPAFSSAGVTAGVGPAESVTIALDSTDQLWVTYTSPIDPTGAVTTDREVLVNRSTSAQHVWDAEPIVLDQVSDDDISAIIAFGSSVGVMWSQQNPSETQTFFHFATHVDSDADTTWSSKQTSAQGTESFAEDHINLKLTATDSGEVLAAVKTNGSSVNHIQLLKRSTGGTWTAHGVVDDEGDVTRPQVVVDETNDVAYVFYTAPELEDNGNQSIYYKSAPLSTLSFTTSGLGTAFIRDGTNDINDVSTAKHPVTETMGGVLGIASSDTNESYYHGWISLGDEPESPFDDVPPSHKFYDEIIYIWEQGITVGCDADSFCPRDPVNRQQMAAFLSRSLDLGPASQDYFDDDETSPHEDHINRLREAGLTEGCGDPEDRTFCPQDNVNRQQMAAFLSRALDLGPASQDYFDDDETSPHEDHINRMREAGLTEGCGDPAARTFCPKNVVNRQQMAAFLYRASLAN